MNSVLDFSKASSLHAPQDDSIAGMTIAWLVRRARFAPTWTPAYATPGLLSWIVGVSPPPALIVGYAGSATGLIAGSVLLHRRDLRAGADLAARARSLRGPIWAIRSAVAARAIRAGRAARGTGIVVGEGMLGGLARIPLDRSQPAHILVAGASGSGKTVTSARIATEAVAKGFGVVIVDPKGDNDMLIAVRDAALASGRRFVVWHPHGNASYNPYRRGDATEVTARLLFDDFSEPHYLRLFQRHVQQVVGAMQSAGMTASLWSIAYYSAPERQTALLERLESQPATRFAEYCAGITPSIVRDLSGSISRLAALSESSIGPNLEPEPDGIEIDLYESLERGDVVYFALNADAMGEYAKMLAAALVLDLVTVAAQRQRGEHRDALVVLDEFSAITPSAIVSLVGRGRSAGVSVLLATQELADIDAAGEPGLLNRITGNLRTVIAHRQVVPESRELLSKIAGTVGAWTQTAQVRTWTGHTGLGSRARDREFRVHPDQLAELLPGEAYLLQPGTKRPVDRIRVFRPFLGWRGGSNAD